MFEKIRHTDHPPTDKPIMLWDGKCGFCHYWIIRWKMITGDQVDYEKYQDAVSQFHDIPEKYFSQAVRLIEPDGRIFNGPEAVYRSFTYGTRWGWLYSFYNNSRFFRWISDQLYQWVSDHRPFMYSLSVQMFGKNPRSLDPYWLVWLLSLLTILLIILNMFF